MPGLRGEGPDVEPDDLGRSVVVELRALIEGATGDRGGLAFATEVTTVLMAMPKKRPPVRFLTVTGLRTAQTSGKVPIASKTLRSRLDSPAAWNS